MPTHADVRQIALSLPEAYEAAHFETVSFRVGKKIFCTMGGGDRIVLKLTPEDQHNLLDGEAIQRVPDSWGAKGWTHVYLKRLEPERLSALVRLAWATVAPRRLLK